MLSRNTKDFPGGASGKESTCQCRRRRDTGSIPGLGRSPGGGDSSILVWRIPMERGAWRATSRGVTRSQTQLKQLSTQHTQKYRNVCPRRELFELCIFPTLRSHTLWQQPLFAESFCWLPCIASPLHRNLQVVNFQSWERSPVCQLSYWTTVLFKVP